ncbi:alpha/beta fold hydrolase [Alcaligenaceae bacterium B3P038]|nr:alpha/beta fold hydrolase [Alcaligenaceae bacterium B3P038]
MPTLKIGDADLYYEEYGQGHPLLLLAPGGLLSHIELWRTTRDGRPRDWPDPVAEFARDFRVIAVDQRNAGRSRAPVRAGDGWHTYVQDHLGLLDALGVDRFHVLGSCIGASFALKLCEQAPHRVTAAVLQQPIGLTTQNADSRAETFDEWAVGVQQRDASVTASDIAGFRRNLFDRDFVYSVTRDAVQRSRVPLLVLAGNDLLHPAAVADEIVALSPNARKVAHWKGADNRATYISEIREFLEHARPAPASHAVATAVA